MVAKPIKLTLHYFSLNGKFKYEGVLELPEGRELFEVGNLISALRRQRRLPGIQSGYWDGYIYANGEDAYPFLVAPDKETRLTNNVKTAFTELESECPYRTGTICENQFNRAASCHVQYCPLLR
jgi:hypothetical protein